MAQQQRLISRSAPKSYRNDVFSVSEGPRRQTDDVGVRKKRKMRGEGPSFGPSQGDDEGDDEVERKIVALRRIVPGGEELGVDKLFEETAGYIMALQCRIKAMRALTTSFQGLEMQMEKRKLGG